MKLTEEQRAELEAVAESWLPCSDKGTDVRILCEGSLALLDEPEDADARARHEADCVEACKEARLL